MKLAKAWIRKIPYTNLKMIEYGDFMRKHRDVESERLELSDDEDKTLIAFTMENESVLAEVSQFLNAVVEHVHDLVAYQLSKNDLKEATAILQLEGVKNTVAALYGADQISQWRLK